MRDAFGTTKESRYAGVVEQDGIPTKTRLKNAKVAPPEHASDRTSPGKLDTTIEEGTAAPVNRGFGLATASLRQALQEMPEIAELSKNIIVEETKDGLDVSLVDQDGRSMFPDGSTQPFDRTRRALERMAPVLRRMPTGSRSPATRPRPAPVPARPVSPGAFRPGAP
jgi:chemotaxis protein MotB